MSGHSKWSTIKRTKGANDAKRGQTFTKIASAIAVAARTGGGGDVDSNPRLRMVLEQARTVNMPKENIQRAIDRGMGNLPGQKLEEISYEGFGPGKVAFIVEAVTDNRNRTLAEVRNIFERSGGALGTTGSVAHMFDQIGEIRVKTKGEDKDVEILELIDLGAEDVEDFEEEGVQKYLVTTKSSSLAQVSKQLTQSGFGVESAELVMRPKITQEITDKVMAQKVVDFAQRLEDCDDIQKVHSNFDIPEEILSTL
ncbi:hypothetical protein A2631_03760 [Candidatus Daviesbacteria bacterium RIFCSPHIGHO2_01_FULL_44_29]|uniref:Probable transcriptional regulatory protein A3D25_00220 n=1 Tax=Candidatus Daviesbacteria bacterium RIFCSPHIGHO2_02_FULL_43_12 TaxID=1797776 RepID=A0A1F5KI09_9BACT|nr:MAG: hypothetical protein A2631_03760 [Candidatus Daviesbacteria bacterium RIFCSPHIGHO2_01_FULL_44_29]OGE39812.1 MAG: hypothetical protein A3E86_04550 [Candidatus Daviesbacteria bacterium RIFCSPHIGHO2_12_FULL_47_45]OGE40474.1 MAG: hypothetical protein A3D25_00220 [Candidatus Daviesbacteria bacterium RIFCSPHIGHO2_02_FULL_43_12]OGE70025.1 MAG: hypothetical protein A3B55_05020 [Candidatus Daviesbacteria bacterium RIFCSPLOWO2_01_FULL_43_15]